MTRTEYQQYLQSDHWKKLRAKKLSKSHRRCAICGSKYRLEVHHLQYRNIFDVDTTDLRILCNRCHDLFHELKRTGKIKLKNGSHHSLFCQTKNYVKVALGMARQRAFGVPWPPPHGKSMIKQT